MVRCPRWVLNSCHLVCVFNSEILQSVVLSSLVKVTDLLHELIDGLLGMVESIRELFNAPGWLLSE